MIVLRGGPGDESPPVLPSNSPSQPPVGGLEKGEGRVSFGLLPQNKELFSGMQAREHYRGALCEGTYGGP